MALSTRSLRQAKSALGVACRAEERACVRALEYPYAENVARLVSAADRVIEARVEYEVERALAHLRAIGGPTTGEQRARLEEAVHATAGGSTWH